MPPITTTHTRRRRAGTTIALLTVSLACLGLGACGSSSSGTSSKSSSPPTQAEVASTPAGTTSQSASSTSTTPASTGARITTGRQFKLLYDCLVREGIRLPSIKELGKTKIDTTSPHYQAVLKKCEEKGAH